MPISAEEHRDAGAVAEAAARGLSRSYNVIAVLRFVCFAGLAVAAAATVADATVWSISALGAAGAAFLGLALWHVQLDDRLRRARLQAEYHRRGIERCEGRWEHGQDDGSGYAPAGHAYAADLDAVGPGSLYQLLDTAGSQPGRAQLARWLLANEGELPLERAAVVRELEPAHSWRAELAVVAAADIAGHEDGDDEVSAWLDDRPTPPGRVWVAPVWIMRLLGPAILALAAWHQGAGGALLALLLVSVLWYPLDLRARAAAGLGAIDRARNRARSYARGLAVLGRAPGDDAALEGLRHHARDGAVGMDELSRVLDGIAKGANALRALLGAVVLIEWRNLDRLHRWAVRHGGEYRAWCETLGRGEALACLATYAAEQGGCWPALATGDEVVAVEDLAHPLLPRATRVGNDITLRDGQVLLLTGANASGKSTFMRSLGLALVLARMGTTVPAASCRLSPMRLATVMRVSDDLRGGRSRFQAEVERLRTVIDLGGEDAPLLLGLDEILGGTNSQERHLGTKAVIDHLRGRRGAVVVSTHDLDLAKLAEAEPERFVLAHFADRAALEGDEGPDMVFDYQLRPGVLESTNALRVMKAFGLPVAEG